MIRKFNSTVVCIVLVILTGINAFSAIAKLDVMEFNTFGQDAHLGKLSVGENLDIDISKYIDKNIFYSKVTSTNVFPEPIFNSKNPSVATVNPTGVVTAVSVGKTVITATFTQTNSLQEVNFTIDVVASKPMPKFVRYGGLDRYETAIIISDNWSSANTVVIANANSFADALVGVPLASMLDAPILLTSGKQLEPAVLSQIQKLGAKKAIILGGTTVVSSSIADTLKTKNIAVERCSGETRYHTAVEIAKYCDKLRGSSYAETAFLTTPNGYADALSISSYAGMKGYPILYVSVDKEKSQPTYDYLSKSKIAEATLIGGENAINNNTKFDIESKTGAQTKRIFGDTRYETSTEIAKTFRSEFSNDITISTGLSFPDALAGGVFAAKNKTPVLLVDRFEVSPLVETYIRTSSPSSLYILGGANVIPVSIPNSIFK